MPPRCPKCGALERFCSCHDGALFGVVIGILILFALLLGLHHAIH